MQGQGIKVDLATLIEQTHAPIVIGAHKYLRDEVQSVLGGRLNALPERVSDTTRFPLGRFRGLAFGIVLHPSFAPDV